MNNTSTQQPTTNQQTQHQQQPQSSQQQQTSPVETRHSASPTQPQSSPQPNQPDAQQLQSAQPNEQPQSNQPVIKIPVQQVPMNGDNQQPMQPQIITVPVQQPQQQPEQKAEEKQKEKTTENKEKMKSLVEDSDRELMHIKSMLVPWDLFPDEIIVREHKVTMVMREFFGSGEIRSFEVKELNEVSVRTGPFLSTIVFTAKIFSQEDNHVELPNFKKSDALKLRALIEGLTAMTENNIDLTQLSKEDIIKKAEEFGGSRVTV